jgi:hypothetical protein
MEEIIGTLEWEDGIKFTLKAVEYLDCQERLRYGLQLEGCDDDLELSGFESINEAAHVAYKFFEELFELKEKPTTIAFYHDEDSEEGIVQIIALRFYNQWDVFFSPRKGEMQPSQFMGYPSLNAARRALYAALGDDIRLA